MLALAMIVCAHPAAAQQRALTQYRVEAWGEDRGLASDYAGALAQTPDGYLWIGLSSGLARFDGAGFTLFDAATTPALRASEITSLATDAGGTLWIGTRGGGLVQYGDGGFRTVPPELQPRSDLIAALAPTADGLWIGTPDGLFRLHAGAIEQQGEANRAVLALAAGRAGLWVGGREGIRLVRGGNEATPVALSGLRQEIRALLEDGDGRLWIGTRNGLHVLHPDAARPVRIEQVADEFVEALRQDRDGAVWIGTSRAVHRWSDGQLETLTTADGLPDDHVRALLPDRDGNMWLGTVSGGAVQLRATLFTPHTIAEGVPGDIVLPILQASDGAMWLGTYGAGVARMQGDSLLHIDREDGLSSDFVLSLAEDGAGGMWIGTRSGLNYWRDHALRRFTLDGQADPVVSALYRDRQGRIWAGTNTGLSRYENGRFVVVPGVDAEIAALLETRDGSIWAATSGRGLLRLQGNRLTWLRTTDGLPSDVVSALHEDSSGTLWIGTPLGLARLDRERVVSLAGTPGMRFPDVNAMLDDGAGFLWISGMRGVFRVPLGQLDSVADGLLRQVRGTLYTSADGMPSSETNGAFQPAAWRDVDGRLWFPTMQGAASVDPAEVRSRLGGTVSPRIESVFANHERVQAGVERIGPGVAHLQADFSAISLAEPNALEFRHRLVGFEDEWITTSGNRSAFYTNLSPRRYVLRLQARRPGGEWEDAAPRTIEVRPFFYQTVAFYVTVLILLGGVLYLLHRVRVRSYQRREALLLHLMSEREAAERRYRDLFENAHDIVLTVDTEGRVAAINGAGRCLLGRNPTGQPLSTVLAGDIEAFMMRLPTSEKPEARTMDLPLRRGDDQTISLEATVQLVVEDDHPVGVQLIARDLTERRHLEEQLRQSQKMEAIGRLSGGVAHDFNNLLTVIKGNLDLALETLHDDHEVRPDLLEIDHSVARAAALTRQLLAFSRKQVLNLEPLDLGTVIRDAERLLQRLLTESVQLHTEIDPKPAMIRADRGQLEQVILNLAVNARDAMPSGGTLYVRSRLARPPAGLGLPSEPHVLLEVADTGCGIEEAELGQIFEPFFTTKEVGKGTGLGLSTVHAIVEQTGGRIVVDSKLRRGTTFRIYLPVCSEAPVQRDPAPAPIPGASDAEWILVVEDEDGVRSVVRRTLVHLGYSVLEAADAASALEILGRSDRQVDLLLSDVVMPHVTGPELAERALLLRPDLKVLYMSGYTRDNATVAVRENLVQKPFTPAELGSAVRHAMDRQVLQVA